MAQLFSQGQSLRVIGSQEGPRKPRGSFSNEAQPVLHSPSIVSSPIRSALKISFPKTFTSSAIEDEDETDKPHVSFNSSLVGLEYPICLPRDSVGYEAESQVRLEQRVLRESHNGIFGRGTPLHRLATNGDDAFPTKQRLVSLCSRAPIIRAEDWFSTWTSRPTLHITQWEDSTINQLVSFQTVNSIDSLVLASEDGWVVDMRFQYPVKKHESPGTRERLMWAKAGFWPRKISGRPLMLCSNWGNSQGQPSCGNNTRIGTSDLTDLPITVSADTKSPFSWKVNNEDVLAQGAVRDKESTAIEKIDAISCVAHDSVLHNHLDNFFDTMKVDNNQYSKTCWVMLCSGQHHNQPIGIIIRAGYHIQGFIQEDAKIGAVRYVWRAEEKAWKLDFAYGPLSSEFDIRPCHPEENLSLRGAPCGIYLPPLKPKEWGVYNSRCGYLWKLVEFKTDGEDPVDEDRQKQTAEDDRERKSIESDISTIYLAAYRNRYPLYAAWQDEEGEVIERGGWVQRRFDRLAATDTARAEWAAESKAGVMTKIEEEKSSQEISYEQEIHDRCLLAGENAKFNKMSTLTTDIEENHEEESICSEEDQQNISRNEFIEWSMG